MKDGPSITYDIDGTTVFKVIAKNRLDLQSTSITADLWLRNNWQEVERNVKRVGNVKALSNEKVKQKKVLHAA